MKIKFRKERREKQTIIRTILTSLLFTVLALAACGIIIAASGFNPIEVYTKMISKVFFTGRGIRKMLDASLPLMLCSLGVALTFKMNLNNIGAEGQYAMGVIFGGAFAMYGPRIDGFAGILMLAVCCFAGGALWALLCAIPRALWDVNESITTLMLNYIALIILSYLCLGPWKAAGQNVGQTEKLRAGLELPALGGAKVSSGIVIGVVAALIIYMIYKSTTLGYQMSVVRYSQGAARFAGINIKRNIILALVISGGLAGLAGCLQYAGVSQRIMEGMPNNAGYTAIVIAYLSKLNPLAIIIVSILFAGLQNSSATVQVMGVPTQIATMIQGTIMLFVIAGDYFQRYRLIRVKEVES
ncbi:MAG: ABC transporter permease [Lachnospiraceae bacterium]|nr:ABC transporter permease [Lachnospiraceae bacterium]